MTTSRSSSDHRFLYGLKERRIDTISDYYDRRRYLTDYLTGEWLRLTQDHVDRENKNQSKSKTLQLWADVAQSLHAWGNAADAPLTPLPKGQVSIP